MELFIKVSFWLYAISIPIRLLALGLLPYPRIVKYKQWEDALHILLAAAWAFWAAYLVWLK